MSRSAWKELCDATARRHSYRYGWIDEPALSAERARAILDAAKADGLNGQAKINSGLTRVQAHEILSGGIPTNGDPLRSITSRNILREFRKQAKAIAETGGTS